MEILICSVPVEAPGTKLRRKRSEGSFPIMPKIAVTSLNHWAEKNGFKCKYYDIDMLYPSDEEVERHFRENPTDIVGLSAVVSTTYMQVKRLARIIKKVNKRTLVVVGGYLTAAANTILRKTEVDICVVGNGEIAWVGILNYMKDHLKKSENRINKDELNKIKGIAILDDKGDLRFNGYGETLAGCNLAFPSFEWLKRGLKGNKEALNNYFRPFYKSEEFIMDPRAFEKHRKPMLVNIFTSKGCVAKCTFCQRGSKGYDVYNLDKLNAYLEKLKNEYNVGFIMVGDENFGSNKKYSYEVAELFHKHDMLWSCIGVRCTSVNKDDLIYYQKNNCSSLKFGIESGSQTMLDVMEKKFTVEDIKKTIFSCADIKLHTPLKGFMIGMPGENEKTIRESGEIAGELIARLRVTPEIIWGLDDIPYALPLIGTPLYEYGRQLGLVGQSVDEEEKYLETTSNIGILKRYYINFNGAPIIEVLFWDMLYFLEITRSYVKFMKGKTIDSESVKKYSKQINLQKLNPHFKAKQKSIQVMGAGTTGMASFSHYFITNFLRKHIVFNSKITRLPRFLVNPVVKYLLYFEWLVQKYLFRDQHNLHKYSNSFANSKIRIKEKELDPINTSQKDRSLRTIVLARAKKINRVTTRNHQEKLVIDLVGGP